MRCDESSTFRRKPARTQAASLSRRSKTTRKLRAHRAATPTTKAPVPARRVATTGSSIRRTTLVVAAQLLNLRGKRTHAPDLLGQSARHRARQLAKAEFRCVPLADAQHRTTRRTNFLPLSSAARAMRRLRLHRELSPLRSARATRPRRRPSAPAPPTRFIGALPNQSRGVRAGLTDNLQSWRTIKRPPPRRRRNPGTGQQAARPLRRARRAGRRSLPNSSVHRRSRHKRRCNPVRPRT